MKKPPRQETDATGDADNGSRSGNLAVKSAGRALDILEMVSRASGQPSFVQISQHLGIPKSSLSLLLGTLVERGYLEQPEQRGGYRLGLGAQRLAVEFFRSRGVVERVIPLLNRILSKVNESCGYYEQRDDYVECIESRLAEHALVFKMFAGERVHMYANSCGKAILAKLSHDDLLEYINRTQFRSYTERTITSASRLLDEIDEIRETGIARSSGEYYPGVAAFATALLEGDRVVGAINIGLPISRLDPEIEELIARELKAIAIAFSRDSAA